MFLPDQSGEEKIPMLVEQSEFIRDELLANSLELYLGIHNECFENEESSETYSEEGSPKISGKRPVQEKKMK